MFVCVCLLLQLSIGQVVMVPFFSTFVPKCSSSYISYLVHTCLDFSLSLSCARVSQPCFRYSFRTNMMKIQTKGRKALYWRIENPPFSLFIRRDIQSAKMCIVFRSLLHSLFSSLLLSLLVFFISENDNINKEKSHCQVKLGPTGVQERGFFSEKKLADTKNSKRQSKYKEPHFPVLLSRLVSWHARTIKQRWVPWLAELPMFNTITSMVL